MSKKFSKLSVLAAAVSLLSSVQARADINVCVWGTITGPDALLNGQSFGVRDYLTFLNETKGGIAGNKVKVLLLDGRYKLEEELKIYRRCVDQEDAVIINGWSTGAAKALRDQITQDKVPFIADSVAAEIIDVEKLPYAFIAGPTYEQQIAIGLRDLAARGGKRVLLMHADNEYGRAPVNNIRKSGIIEKLGLTLVETIEFPFDAQDLTPQLLRAKASNPDLIYVQGSAQNLIVILRDATKIGSSAKLIMANFLNVTPAIPEQLGAAAEGFRVIQVYSPFGSDILASQQIKVFGEKNEILKKDSFYMKGWLKGQVIAGAIGKAIEKNGGNVPTDIKAFRQSVRDQLEGLKAFDVGGITPPTDFSDHQGSVRARISTVQGGQFVPSTDWIDPR